VLYWGNGPGRLAKETLLECFGGVGDRIRRSCGPAEPKDQGSGQNERRGGLAFRRPMRLLFSGDGPIDLCPNKRGSKKEPFGKGY